MSAPARPSTALVDTSFRAGLEAAGGRVLDVVELAPVRTHLLGGRDRDSFGGSSLRYEVASAAGGRHTYRVYLPASRGPVYVSKSTNANGTITAVTSLRDVAAGLSDDEALYDSHRTITSTFAGTPSRPHVSWDSLVVTNATALRLERAVEASGLADDLSSREDLLGLLSRCRALGLEDGLGSGLWAALQGFDPPSTWDSPDSVPVRVAVLLEAVADGAPLEWMLRRATVGEAES